LATVLDEDASALEAQEIGMQTRPEGEFDVLIAQDGGVAKARRILSAMLKKEQQAKSAAGSAVRREPVAPRTA
jgi:vanillate O-demethylase monooxygenase subunit